MALHTHSGVATHELVWLVMEPPRLSNRLLELFSDSAESLVEVGETGDSDGCDPPTKKEEEKIKQSNNLHGI